MASQGDIMTPVVYFCGCVSEAGHMMWECYEPGNRLRLKGFTLPVGAPWSQLDRDWGQPARQGASSLHHKHGWTLLDVTDYSIDTRPGSHAAFAIPVSLSFEWMLWVARVAYPDIVERLGEIERPA